MAKKKADRLPRRLRYLQPFADVLSKLPPDRINEDIDPSELEAALRERLRGLDEEAAETELAKDRVQLEEWLVNKPENPAHWIFGFILAPDIAMQFTTPPETGPAVTRVNFEAPSGWNVKSRPFGLELEDASLFASISPIDEQSFRLLQLQREERLKGDLAGLIKLTTKVSDVTFEPCKGKKYVDCEAGRWKQIDYILSVPSGFVFVRIGRLNEEDADFDESPLESKLHTIRLSTSG